MPKNTSNIGFGPVSSVQISGSFGIVTDIGYIEGVDITYEPTPMPINDGQMFQGTGLAKCEVRARQTDAGIIASASLMASNGGEITVVAVDGTTYTCGPALAQVKVDRPFEAGEGHFLTLTIQQQVVSESVFTVQS
jgi:hypothetical protein